jgi:hypothetical protein
MRRKLTGMSKSQEIVALFVVIDKLFTGRFTGREGNPTDCLAHCRNAERRHGF